MTINRERAERLVNILMENPTQNECEEASDLIETLIRENEALREQLQTAFSDGTNMFNNASKALDEAGQRIAELERENEALRNDLSLSNNAWEKSQAHIAALRKEQEALRFALAFTPKPTDYGTA